MIDTCVADVTDCSGEKKAGQGCERIDRSQSLISHLTGKVSSRVLAPRAKVSGTRTHPLRHLILIFMLNASSSQWLPCKDTGKFVPTSSEVAWKDESKTNLRFQNLDSSSWNCAKRCGTRCCVSNIHRNVRLGQHERRLGDQCPTATECGRSMGVLPGRSCMHLMQPRRPIFVVAP